eukprot:GHVR01062864.1.p3 GENE.GHVR01062864.1~~GHVR01062864.1.p3  ORF type:complete len:125 (+),score=28.08 GHVR01062864.1:359-733(+)
MGELQNVAGCDAACVCGWPLACPFCACEFCVCVAAAGERTYLLTVQAACSVVCLFPSGQFAAAVRRAASNDLQLHYLEESVAKGLRHGVHVVGLHVCAGYRMCSAVTCARSRELAVWTGHNAGS